MLDKLHSLVEEALSLGARYAEARFYNSPTTVIVVQNGNPVQIASSTDFGVAVRVIYENGIGFASTNDVSKIKELPKRAIEMAKSAQRKEPIKFSEDKFEKARYKVEAKKTLGLEDRLELLKDLDKHASEGVERSTRMFMLRETIERRMYVNSEGAEVESEIPRINLFYNLAVIANGDAESYMSELGRAGGFELFNEDVFNEVRSNMLAIKDVLENSRPFPAGYYDVILGPSVVGLSAHESAGHPMEADRIFGREAAQAGESFVDPEGERRLGKRIGSEVVNVVDDPTVEHSYGYYLYDDEGVKARRRYLYKEGIINEPLMNREYAGLLGTLSNAAGRSSEYDREPIPRMSTTFVEPKDRKLEELVEDIKKGIRIETYTERNIDDIRRNQRYVGSDARYIENGEKKFRIRRPVIELTTKTRRSSIDAVGNDLKFYAGECGKGDPMQGVPVRMGGPHVRMRNVYIFPAAKR